MHCHEYRRTAAGLLFFLSLLLPVCAGPALAGNDITVLLDRVVIDPGHGGGDSGMVGPSGLSESELSLMLAEQLKDALESEFGVKVFLTREQGQNPALADRTGTANGLKADVFISLHAGGASGGKEPGFNVYFQDYRLLADLDRDDLSEGSLDAGQPKFWVLAQAGHREASMRLARELDLALEQVLHYRNSRPAGLPLAVLAGADQPAVLVEVGSLENPEAERRLKTQGYRDALTRAFVRAFRAYIGWLNSPPVSPPPER